jgi:hypothetical protein
MTDKRQDGQRTRRTKSSKDKRQERQQAGRTKGRNENTGRKRQEGKDRQKKLTRTRLDGQQRTARK